MKKLIAIITALFIFTISLVYFLRSSPDSLSAQFSLWNVHAEGVQNFAIEEREIKRVEDSEITDLTAGRGEQVFRVRRITNVAKDAAANYINDQRIKLESIFNPAPSPYFAILTKEIECPKDFLPIYNESIKASNKVLYYILYANERLNYGVCSEDLIAYRAINGFTYCENTKDLYHLEYFVPNEEYGETIEEIIRAFSCQRKAYEEI